MGHAKDALVLLFFVGILELCDGQQYLSSSGYRLAQTGQYVIIAPKKIRPDGVYRVHVSLFRLASKSLRIQASLSSQGEEYATSSVYFTEPATKTIEMDIEENIPRGNGTHRLLVEGLVGTGAGQPIFSNFTAVQYESKYVSLFIQTDRPIYYAPMKVLFRIIGVRPDLLPMYGTMTIYIVDARGNIVQRWLQQQLNLGIFSGSFELIYPVNVGTWKIRVDGFGHIYEQDFTVDLHFPLRFEVNTTTPMFMMDSEWGVIGTVYGEHLSGRAATGNATVTVRVKNPDGTFENGELTKKISWMTGTVPFDFSMDELKEEFGEVGGKELHFKGWIFDWYWLETENGTSVTKVIKDGVKVQILGRRFRTFKPETPFSVYFAVSRTDGTPYLGQYNRQVSIQVIHEGQRTSTVPEQKLIIPDDNIVKLDVLPEQGDTVIKIRAWHQFAGSTGDEIQYFKYFSPYDKYIGLTTSTPEPRVNEYMIFTVRTNVNVEQVHYLIMGAGNILMSSSLQMTSQQKTFSIALSRAMSPRCRIIAYFLYNDEVVVDSLNFFVKDKRLHKANMTLNFGKDFRQDTMEIVARGSPGSFLMTVGHDYELYRRGGQTFLDEKKIVRELSTYDEGNQGPYEHVWYHDSHQWDEQLYFNAPTDGIDTLQTFQTAGLIVMSDMNQTYVPEIHICNKTLGFGRCLDGSCYELYKACDGLLDCSDGYDEAGCPFLETPKRRPDELKTLSRFSRYYSEVDWLWHFTYIKPNGQTELKIDVPESTNPYVVSAFVLHPTEGLAVMDEVGMIDATRVFFMGAEMPDTAKRGEQIGLRLSLFNNFAERLEIIVVLHGDENYRFVMVEDNGVVSSYAPRLAGGDHMIMVTLDAGTNTYVHFPFVPTVLGEVTVRASAYSFLDNDHEELTLTVSMDGVINGDHTPYLIDLVNQGSIVIPDFDSPVPEIFIYPEEAWHIYVPGSEEAIFTLFGDVVGPGFYEPHLDASNVVGVPHDSAEGYMFDFAINLAVLNHLQSTNTLNRDKSYVVLDYMRSVLMRQYAYMAEDGSYKMFRRDSEPCMWVTAFVGQVLHDCLASEWGEDVFIPVELVNKITNWIVSKQNTSTGHFEETTDIEYYRAVQNPITVDPNGVEHVWHIATTAYVTIMLAKNTRLTGNSKTKSESAKGLAAEYLSSKIPFITDPYQMAITAYALQRAGHRDRDNAYARLLTLARRGESVYWSSVEIEPNPTEIINTVPIMKVRSYFTDLGSAVAATSYALMLHLEKNDWEGATAIMKWIQTQRNGMVRWSGTQDTLVCYEALAQYAVRQTNRDIYQMEVTLESTASVSWSQTVRLNMTNFDVLYSGQVPKAFGQVRAKAKGTGYGMLQMDYAMNTEKIWQVSGPEFETYNVEVVNQRFSGYNSSIMDIEMCTSWARPDLAPMAGMTAMTIAIPTGFVIQRPLIDAMYNAGYPGLRRVRFRDGTLILLWQNMTQEKTCFTFRAERWYPVANVSIQHLINVYEYAETGIQKNTQYETFALFHQHICQVCGSYQCPYCPFFNTAPHSISSFQILFLTFLSVILILRFQKEID